MTTATQPAAPTPRGIHYQAILLGSVALLAATLLAVADRVTRAPIALRQAEDLSASLSQVIPDRIHDNALAKDPLLLTNPQGQPITVYRAVRAGQVTGVAFQVKGFGYAGEIQLVMGLDTAGRVLGTRVLAHKETPGLGDKIEAAKDDWILAFAGRALGDPPAERWGVKKDGGDFDQFSGATITPRAVVKALKGGLEFFASNRGAILAPPLLLEGNDLSASERQ